MKKQKLFAMMTVILAMGLAACGGKTSSKESEKPSSAEPTPSSQVTPSSSSEAPKPSSSSSAPQSSQSTPQPSSSSSAPASSSSQPASSSSEVTPPEPVKAVTVSSVNLVAKESKVYLQLVGTATEYTAAEFKWALALQHAGAAGGGRDGEGTSPCFDARLRRRRGPPPPGRDQRGQDHDDGAGEPVLCWREGCAALFVPG